jgi:beta-lysine 5,6-aminomutase alpha subunit
LIEELSNPQTPWLYVIVATGNIYEDIVQAQAAARQDADVIAVIRSTAQSLLDYVPFGPTTEGFGGTYATQTSFKRITTFLQL